MSVKSSSQMESHDDHLDDDDASRGPNMASEKDSAHLKYEDDHQSAHSFASINNYLKDQKDEDEISLKTQYLDQVNETKPNTDEQASGKVQVGNYFQETEEEKK